MDSAAAAVAQAQAGADDDFAADEAVSATLSDALRAAFALIASPEAGIFEAGPAAAAAGHPSLLLPRADAAVAVLGAVGRLLAKAWVEGVAVDVPLAPTALAALLGRLYGGGSVSDSASPGTATGNGVLGGSQRALEHLAAWDPPAADRLWAVLLGEGASAADAMAAAGLAGGGSAPLAGAGRPAAVEAAAAAVLLGGGRGAALESLGHGFLEVVAAAGVGSALDVLDEWALGALFFGAGQLEGGAALTERLDWDPSWPENDPQRALLPALLARLEPPAARLLLARCTGSLRPLLSARMFVRRLTEAGAVARAARGVLELPAECEDKEQMEARLHITISYCLDAS